MFRRTIFPIFGLLIVLLLFVLVALRLSAAQRESEARDAVLPLDGRLIETRLGAVYVNERGPVDGVPVLLVHGSVGWAGFWVETTNALAAAGYRAIAFDLSPMGFSDRDPIGDYARVRQADRLVALTEALEIKPILVAHSFGAGPGVEAVMRVPEAFRSAVIVAGALGVGAKPKALPAVLHPKWVREFAVAATITNPPALPYLLKLFLHRKDRATPAYIDILTRPYPREGTTAALADWLPTLFSTDADALSIQPDAYSGITMPMGLIWGEEDTTTPISQGEWLVDAIGHSTLTRLPDVGHIPQIEDPNAFQAALINLLRGL